MALEMAKKGCNLVLHSRKLENTAKIEAEAKALGVQAYSVAAELSDLPQVTRMLDEIEGKGTQIDILLNDAAVQIAYRTEPFATPAEDYSASFVINTIAPMMICYRLVPKMIERGFGRVINTTSGIKDDPHQAGYSASKAALDKVTCDLATITDGTDVVISLVDPGWCRTDLGGPNAFHAPEDALPGMVVGAFVSDKKSGRLFSAQEYSGLSVEDAVKKAESK
jgi:short-subunit dehydrogenase